jgi:hypothetical protein
LAWNASTDFAKTAAAAVATGAVAVGKAGVAASKWAASKTVDAAKWAAEETAAAAKWTESKVAQGAQMAQKAAIAGVRGTAKTIGSSGLGLLGDADYAGREIGRKVSTALDKVKSVFSDSKPAEPVAPCPLNPSKDVDFDGTLISYPGGKCDAVTSKGQKVGPEAIANAEANAYESQSACCQTKRRNGMAPRTIVYVNGINTNKSTDCGTLKAIGDATCAKVYGVYNATEGFYRDAVQTSQDRKAIAAANEGHPPRTGDGRNPAADTLARLIKSKRLNGEPLELWAHSQGGAVSSLALYDAKNALDTAGIPDGLKGVQVKSFGSAAPEWPNGPEYEHYVHVNDFTPVTFGLGDDQASDGSDAGEGAKVIRFSGDPSGGPFATDHLQKSAMPAPTANHDVTGTYLKMETQQHGGCD